jgi:hypothetical protein
VQHESGCTHCICERSCPGSSNWPKLPAKERAGQGLWSGPYAGWEITVRAFALLLYTLSSFGRLFNKAHASGQDWLKLDDKDTEAWNNVLKWLVGPAESPQRPFDTAPRPETPKGGENVKLWRSCHGLIQRENCKGRVVL